MVVHWKKQATVKFSDWSLNSGYKKEINLHRTRFLFLPPWHRMIIGPVITNRSFVAVSRVWLPGDEIAMGTDRFMHCTLHGLSETTRGRK
jgi:hypothetical protein